MLKLLFGQRAETAALVRQLTQFRDLYVARLRTFEAMAASWEQGVSDRLHS